MSRTLLLLAAAALLMASSPSLLQAQTHSHPHGRTPARTVGHPVIQHGAIQSSFKGDCGCGAVPAPSCGTCNPCCPPIIPCILNKFDRLLHCLLPSCRVGCGGCGLCGGAKFNGCCDAPGMVMDHGVIIDQKVAPQAAPQAAPKQTYYQRRGSLQPRYQASRAATPIRPTPVRRTATPKPTRQTPPTTRTRTASTEVKETERRAVEQPRVESQPAPRANVRVASFRQAQATEKPESNRIRNPLRDN